MFACTHHSATLQAANSSRQHDIAVQHVSKNFIQKSC